MWARALRIEIDDYDDDDNVTGRDGKVEGGEEQNRARYFQHTIHSFSAICTARKFLYFSADASNNPLLAVSFCFFHSLHFGFYLISATRLNDVKGRIDCALYTAKFAVNTQIRFHIAFCWLLLKLCVRLIHFLCSVCTPICDNELRTFLSIPPILGVC